MRAPTSSLLGLALGLALYFALALSLVPSVAFADPLPDPALLAKWALPMFVGDAAVLLAAAFAFAAIRWNRLGLLLWVIGVTAAGCLFVFTMPHALKEPRWQLPAFMGGFLLFVFVAEQARKRLVAR